MKVVGYFPGSFKPLHSGHFQSILSAASNVDHLVVVLSEKDRVRPGEFPLSGDAAKTYIQTYVQPYMEQRDIELTFTSVPVRYVYESIEEQQTDPSLSFVVYAGPEDITERFSKDKLERYFPQLVKTKRIKAVPLEEVLLPSGDGRVRGSLVRQALAQQDTKMLKGLLPQIPSVQRNVDKIMKLFVAGARSLDMSKIKKAIKESIASVFRRGCRNLLTH